MEFHVAHEHLSEVTSKLGFPLDNSKASFQASREIFGEGEITGSWLEANTGYSLITEAESSHTQTTSKEGATDIGFVLGDGDSDDHFVVDIYTDPKYGTFLFKTTSGLSMCMHEEGTEAAAIPSIQVSMSPVRAVLPDAAMVFRFRLANAGPVAYRFQLFAYHNTNFDGLEIVAHGGALDGPIVYSIDGNSEIFTTISVHRGPKLYEYNPIELGFRLACDNTPFKSQTNKVTLYNDNVDREKKIVFAEPCQQIYWAGLEDGYKLTIKDN